MALFVAVAHNGKTLQLGVSGSQRVEAVQQALVTFTGIPIPDQILMLAGSKLDAARTLSAYRLPMEDVTAAADHPLILYCKSYLRPDGAQPPAEPLTPITPQVPPALSSAALAAAVSAHPLSHSPHALVRSLPGHEAAFSHHVAKAAAYMEASLARLHRCRQLLSEQEVQSRAADAATVNVEAHYAFISTAMASFTSRYNQQCADHAQLLANFSEDQALLDNIPLHSILIQATTGSLGTQGASGTGAAAAQGTGQTRRLADLPGAVRARDVAAACRRHHGQFAEKVSQLEGVYESMKLDMEALIMQAPSVDLDALGVQLVEAEGWVQEQQAIVQVLSKDLATIQQLVEKVVRQSASSTSTSPNPSTPPPGDGLLDACQAVQSLATAHTATQLPRVEALDAAVAVLEERCAQAKARMTTDVVSMLQCISQQQSKIRDMRARLTGFDALLQRQASMFAELRPLGRLPAAYRALLAECERVKAWHQLKAGQAAEFVDNLVAQYQTETVRRKSFIQQVERYLPADLIAAAGLHEASLLGLPSVSIPPSPAHLLPVSLQDVQRLPTAPPGVAVAMSAMSQLLQTGPPQPASTATPAGEEMILSQVGGGSGGDLETLAGDGGAGGQLYAPPLPDPTSMHRLEMENARLRAELADLMVEQSLVQLSGAGTGTQVGGGLPPLASGFLPRALGASQAGTLPTPVGAAGLLEPQGTPRQTSLAGQAPVPSSHSGGTAGTSPSGPNRGLTTSTSWRRHTSTAATTTLPSPSSPHSGVAAAAPIPAPSGPSPAAAGIISAPHSHSRSHSSVPTSSAGVFATSPGTRQVGLGTLTGSGISSMALAGPPPHPSQHSQALGTPVVAGAAASSRATSFSRQMSGVGIPSPATQQPQALPGSIVATLQQSVAGAAGGASSGGWSSAAPAAAAVTALQQAVVMKEAYCAALQHELQSLTRKINTYEGRIMELESRLAETSRRPLVTLEPSTTITTSITTEANSTFQLTTTAVPTDRPGQVSQPNSAGGAVPNTRMGSIHEPVQGDVLDSQQDKLQQEQQPSSQHDMQEDFDPLAFSNYGEGPASVGRLAGAGASTVVGVMDEDTEVHGSQADGFPQGPGMGASTMTSGTAGGSAAASAASTSASGPALPVKPNVLGPIALAAISGSRGHTPEPHKGFSVATGTSVVGVARADASLAALPLLLGTRTDTPDTAELPGAPSWPLTAAASGPWVGHPLCRGRWGSGVLPYAMATEQRSSAPTAVTAIVAAGGSLIDPQQRGRSHDGVVPVSIALTAVEDATAAAEVEIPLVEKVSAPPVLLSPAATGTPGLAFVAGEAAAAEVQPVLRPVATVGVSSEAAIGAAGVQALPLPSAQPDPPANTTSTLVEAVESGEAVVKVGAVATAEALLAPALEASGSAASETTSRLGDSGTATAATERGAATQTWAVAEGSAEGDPLSASGLWGVSFESGMVSRQQAGFGAPVLAAGATEEEDPEEEDDAVPDINDVMEAEGDGGTAMGGVVSGSAGGAINAGGGFGDGEARTWPAAGSGLGASVLLGVSTAEVEDTRVQDDGGLSRGQPALDSSMYASAMASESVHSSHVPP